MTIHKKESREQVWWGSYTWLVHEWKILSLEWNFGNGPKTNRNSLEMDYMHTQKKLQDPLAHCPPCEERWEGPPDLTWELVSICIHDNKQLYHTHTHFKFNTIFQPICHHCTNTNLEYFFYKCDEVFIKTYFLYTYFYKVFRETLQPEYWQFFHWGSIDWMNSCNLASHFRSGLGVTRVRPPLPSLGFRERH